MHNKIILFLVVLVLLVWWYTASSKEHFKADEYKQSSEGTKPQLYDRRTGVITAASEFIGLPAEIMPAWGTGDSDMKESLDGFMGLQNNMCSKSCCSAQYPPPFALEKDEFVCKNKDKFVENNYKCNNAWQDSGCLCMTEKQRDFLANRGQK